MSRRTRRSRVTAADDDQALDTRFAGRGKRLGRWRDWRTYVGVAGALFVTLGLLVLAFVAYELWGTGIQEAHAQRQLRHRFDEMLSSTAPPASTAPDSITPAPVVPAPIGPPATTVPGVQSSSGPVPLPVRMPQATEPPPTVPAPDEPSSHPEIKEGDPVARLQIPAIGVDKVVVSGVFSDDLERGPGHYPATPLPGEVGNAGIAGHRTTYGAPFGDLDKLQPKDEIIVTTIAGRFRFVVVGTKIVQPSDASVLAPSDDVRLTLTTCDPRYSTAHRLIVTAVLDTQPPDEPATTTATTPPPVAPTTTVADTTPATLPPATPPSTSAATTVPTTTVGAEQQVNDAYLASWPRYWACVRNPTSCAPDELTARQGSARQALTKTVEDLRARNLHVGDEDPGYAVIEKTVVDVATQTASVWSCVWDTDVLYGPPAEPGGPATIVSNLRFSKMYQHDLYYEDGAWKIGEERELSRGPEGVNQCPPEP